MKLKEGKELKMCDVCFKEVSDYRETRAGFVVCKECRELPLSATNDTCRRCDRFISKEEDDAFEGMCRECHDAEKEEYWEGKNAEMQRETEQWA